MLGRRCQFDIDDAEDALAGSESLQNRIEETIKVSQEARPKGWV
jgi:hypothetical protein